MTHSSRRQAPSRTWSIAIVVVGALFALSAVAATIGPGESTGLRPDAWDWTMSPRSIVTEPNLLYSWNEPELNLNFEIVGSPQRFFVVFLRDDENGDVGYAVDAIDNSGERVWTRHFPGSVEIWSIDGGLIVYAHASLLSSFGVLYRLNPATGEPVWQVDIKADDQTTTEFNGRLYVSDGSWLTAIDLENGTIIASAFHDAVGDLDDLRRGGGLAVRDEPDVVVLNADLDEVARFSARGDGAVSYAQGQVLAFDRHLPLNGTTARLYGDDGVEVATIQLDSPANNLAAIDGSTWVYSADVLLDPTCGAVSVSDGELVELWEHDDCDLEAIAKLDDGESYVMSWTGGDREQGAFYHAATGEPVDIPVGVPTLGSNGFLTSSVDTDSSYALTTDGQVTTFDDFSVDMIDGGWVVAKFRDDRPSRVFEVYGPG